MILIATKQCEKLTEVFNKLSTLYTWIKIIFQKKTQNTKQHWMKDLIKVYYSLILLDYSRVLLLLKNWNLMGFMGVIQSVCCLSVSNR